MSQDRKSDAKSPSAAFGRAQEPDGETPPPAPAQEEASGLRKPHLFMEDPHPLFALPTRHRPDLLFPSEPPAPPKPLMTREAFFEARRPALEDEQPNIKPERRDR